MAARLNLRHTESCLKRIKTSQLLNRIQNHGLGETEMTLTQLKAACFLVERTLARAVAPQDLNVTGNLQIEIVRFTDSTPR
jgi:hypothetical protein